MLLSIFSILIIFKIFFNFSEFLHLYFIKIGVFTNHDGYYPRDSGLILPIFSDLLTNYNKSIPDAKYLVPSYNKIQLNKRPDIFIFILESLSDPMRWNEPPLIDPICPIFRSYLKGISHVPIFGGNTIQSEFEILTGVPCAFEHSAAAFQQLKGFEVPSLVRLLRDNGYLTSVFCASSPRFCNIERAYKSFGFEKMFFNPDFFKLPLDGGFVSTEAYKNTIMKYLSSIKNSTQSNFIYSVLTSGHAPYVLSEERDPKIHFSTDKTVNNYCNSLYVNTKETSIIISEILKIYPEALIIITGDHQPWVAKGKFKGLVARTIYNVPYGVINNGEWIPRPETTHYGLTWELIESLTDDLNLESLYGRVSGNWLRPIHSRWWRQYKIGLSLASENKSPFVEHIDAISSIYKGIILKGRGTKFQ